MTVRTLIGALCGILLMGTVSTAYAIPVPVDPVPEPGTYAMLAAGAVTIGGFLMSRNRRNRK